MLRINQNSHASGAKSYYSSSDYYVDGQELSGVWRGKGAAMLGLTGEIQRADWDALCDGINPKTGDRLLQRLKENRTICYDLNWHAPKSLSMMYALTGDDRLLDAFREAVNDTMRDIEADMQTRVRKDGKNEDRTTGNMIWGEFVHLTSRPVDGVPDPHLHLHGVAFMTYDPVEHRWKSGQYRAIKQNSPYYEAMFHARLSRKLADLGLPIERKGRKSWDIAGIPQSVLKKFSRRTEQIEEKAAQQGITDPELKAELGAKTRSRKAKDLTMPQLRAHWLSRLSSGEQDAISGVAKRIGGLAQPVERGAAARAVSFAARHHFERQSVVPQRVLLATALRQAFGQATPDQVARELDRSGVIIGDRNGRRMATTREVLAEERRIVDFARGGRGTLAPLGKPGWKPARGDLSASQQAAVRHLLESRDRVTVLRGVAGSGKTKLMREVVAAIESGGAKVLPLAPTADASRGVLRSEGFRDADTVARLLLDERLQQASKGKVLWIDEAGLLSVKTTAQLFDLADRLGGRILLSGDSRQHAPVARGSMLQLLEDEAGIRPAEVREIKRQSGEYKAAVKAMSQGKVAEGFNRLDRLGWIREIPHDERYKQLAADYVDAVMHGRTALVVSPTHAEGERITADIRASLKAAGRIGKQEREFPVLVNANLTEAERGDPLNYRHGDMLQFHQNAKGYMRGQRVAVNGKPLPLDQANRFALFHRRSLALSPGDMVRITLNGRTLDGKHQLNNGALYRVKSFDRQGNVVLDNGWTMSKHFGHLAQGFCVTSHKSQGKTVDRVFVGQSSQSFPASSREQFYVSCSRARESVTVYCDDKEALREVVGQSEDRPSAIELMTGLRRRQLAAEHHRDVEHVADRGLMREERVHER
jgi:conjugative relaxase-like TrwC/TraI family protein